MKAIGILLTIIIYMLLWSPFFVTIFVNNNIKPDFFSIIVCFQTGLLSFYFAAKFIEWFNSNIKQ